MVMMLRGGERMVDVAGVVMVVEMAWVDEEVANIAGVHFPSVPEG